MFSSHSWEGNTQYWRFSTNFAYLFPHIPYFHFISTPDKRFSWESLSHINFLLSLIFIFLTPDKRIHEGLFWRFSGGGPLINVFLRVYFNFFDELRIVISSYPLFSYFLTPDKCFPDVLFWRFSTNFAY